jgi:hypothetical protein
MGSGINGLTCKRSSSPLMWMHGVMIEIDILPLQAPLILQLPQLRDHFDGLLDGIPC